VLSDPQKRVQYDSQGFAGVAGFSPEDLFGGINFEDILGGLDLGFGGGMFDRFFRRRPPGPPRGADIEVELAVPLETVASGGSQKVHYSKSVPCPDCKGSGAKAGTVPRQCAGCKGTGHKVTRRQQANILIQQSETCTECRGHGTIIDQPCTKCSGLGEIAQEEELEITIPRGVEEGMALRIAGRGQPAPQPGGISGDLFVRIVSSPDTRFTRSGNDLWREQEIPVFDAVLGTTLRVPTLRRSATVRVPPGTQSGTILRLKGQGLPEFRGTGRGDLLMHLVVKLPEHVGPEEKNLYERLRELARAPSVKQ
jgi:molecular chaperone DnaJ